MIKSKINLVLITFLFLLVFLSGCTEYRIKNKLEGLWAVDINDEIIEKNGWFDILGNTIYLEADFSCRGLAFKNTKKETGRLNEDGLWEIVLDKDEIYIILNVTDNPINGKYKVDFYRDYENKLLKMKLSNSTTEFTCAKFFQNFDRVKNW